MKRSGFKWKPRKPLRRTALKQVGTSYTTDLKTQIQAVLREYVTIRDGGCILRNDPEAGPCSGYRNDGELILQAEHLYTRANAASFADHRLVVCICRNHHIYYKPQYPLDYYRIVRYRIGKERSDLLDRVMEDRHAHKVDLMQSLIGLRIELKRLKELSIGIP